MFARRRRRRGLGLGGLALIIALLVFTGAGSWLWQRTLELEGQCYTLVAQTGSGIGNPVCAGIGSVVRGIDRFFQGIDQRIGSQVDSVRANLSGLGTMESSLGDLRLSSALARLGSSKDELARKLAIGPESLAVGDQVSRAIDSFAIGKRYLDGDGSASWRAVPWLQQGAQVPGYGVLSQLSLGELYRTGQGGVGQNPAAAIGYYSQAHQSIGLLQQSNTPEAQRVLSALPGSPANVQAQLGQIIQQLKIKP